MRSMRIAWVLACTSAVLVGLSGCRLTDLRLWLPGGRGLAICPVDRHHDLAYHAGPDADAQAHRLDLYLPRGRTGYPMVLLVHGGVWMFGDNRCCGLYSSVAECLAAQGIGVAMPRYRLAPGARHPEQVQDVARALAWLHQHAATWGGSPERLYVAGHSAGGHLVSLLVTDPCYLTEVGLSPATIQGVISVSGVYRIPSGPLDVRLGGTTALSLRLDELLPLRGVMDWSFPGRGLPLRVDVFAPAFGTDGALRLQASPVRHVRPGLPPFLILHAEKDLPTLSAMAEEFHAALTEQGCASRIVRVPRRNHHSILFQAIETGDPVIQEILAFLVKAPRRPA